MKQPSTEPTSRKRKDKLYISTINPKCPNAQENLHSGGGSVARKKTDKILVGNQLRFHTKVHTQRKVLRGPKNSTCRDEAPPKNEELRGCLRPGEAQHEKVSRCLRSNGNQWNAASRVGQFMIKRCERMNKGQWSLKAPNAWRQNALVTPLFVSDEKHNDTWATKKMSVF